MTPSASGAANARSSFFDGRGSKARGGTARCVQFLGAQTAIGSAATARENDMPWFLDQIGPAASRVRSPQEPADPDFSAADLKIAEQYIYRYASLCLLRTKRANQLTTLTALQPQPVHGARQPEPQACKNYTAPSAEYRLHVNIINKPYKGA